MPNPPGLAAASAPGYMGIDPGFPAAGASTAGVDEAGAAEAAAVSDDVALWSLELFLELEHAQMLNAARNATAE
jgi:hypothetical protein